MNNNSCIAPGSRRCPSSRPHTCCRHQTLQSLPELGHPWFNQQAKQGHSFSYRIDLAMQLHILPRYVCIKCATRLQSRYLQFHKSSVPLARESASRASMCASSMSHHPAVYRLMPHTKKSSKTASSLNIGSKDRNTHS